MENRIVDEIKQLNQEPVSEDLLLYVTIRTYTAIPKPKPNDDKNSVIFSASERLRYTLPPLSNFINMIVNRAKVKAGTLLGYLAFLTRLTKALPTGFRGMPCACYRVFLACLIVSYKTFNDVSPKNSYWHMQVLHFNLREINLMEREFLLLLEYRTWIKPNEFTNTYNDFHLFDLHMLIRQAHCASNIKRYYVNQDPMYSNSSESTLGNSDDSLNKTEDGSEEDDTKTSQEPSFSLKEIEDASEIVNEPMVTIIDEDFSIENLVLNNQQQQQQQ